MLEALSVQTAVSESTSLDVKRVGVVSAQVEGVSDLLLFFRVKGLPFAQQFCAVQKRAPWAISDSRTTCSLTLPWVIYDMGFVSNMRVFPGPLANMVSNYLNDGLHRHFC